MNDDQMRELFGEMREETVPGESLARVRMAIGSAVQSRRRMFGAGWKIAALLAAAGCLALVTSRVWTAAPVQTPVQTSVQTVPQAPAVAATQDAPVELAPPVTPSLPAVEHKRVRAVAQPVRHVQSALIEGGASEIRIESDDDPDVVIVLIGG